MSRTLPLLVVASVSCIRPNPLFIDVHGQTSAQDSDPGEGPRDDDDGSATGTGDDPTGTIDPTGDPPCDTVCPDPACSDPPCDDDLGWLVRTGDAARQLATDVVVLADGSVVVVGEFTGELGQAPNVITTTDPADTDGFVMRFAPAGELLWIRQFGGHGPQRIAAAAVLPGDVLAVTGGFSDTLVVDDRKVAPIGKNPGFLAILTPGGTTTTIHLIGGDDVAPLDLAPGPDDDLLLAGRFTGSILFPGAKYIGDGVDLFAARIDLAGGPEWTFAPVAPGDQIAHAIALAPGGPVLAGEFGGTVNFGPDLLTAAGVDGFVARLDPAGAPQSGARIGGPGDDRVRALALASDGAAVIAGVHQGGLDLGAGPLADTPGVHDGFIAALDPDGALRWARHEFLLDHDAPALAVDPAGDVLAALPVTAAPVDLGGGPLTGAPGLLLVNFAPDGAFLHDRRLAGALAPLRPGLGVGPDRRIAVAGGFDPELSHAGVTLQSAGQLDVFAGLFLP